MSRAQPTRPVDCTTPRARHAAVVRAAVYSDPRSVCRITPSTRRPRSWSPGKHYAPRHTSHGRAHDRCHGTYGSRALGVIRPRDRDPQCQERAPVSAAALVRGSGSRGTRTHSLRIKSPELSYQISALSVRLYRSVHIQHHPRAAKSRSVPVRFGTAEQTTSKHGRPPNACDSHGCSCRWGDTPRQHMARPFTIRRAVPHSGWRIAYSGPIGFVRACTQNRTPACRHNTTGTCGIVGGRQGQVCSASWCAGSKQVRDPP